MRYRIFSAVESYLASDAFKISRVCRNMHGHLGVYADGYVQFRKWMKLSFLSDSGTSISSTLFSTTSTKNSAGEVCLRHISCALSASTHYTEVLGMDETQYNVIYRLSQRISEKLELRFSSGNRASTFPISALGTSADYFADLIRVLGEACALSAPKYCKPMRVMGLYSCGVMYSITRRVSRKLKLIFCSEGLTSVFLILASRIFERDPADVFRVLHGACVFAAAEYCREARAMGTTRCGAGWRFAKRVSKKKRSNLLKKNFILFF